MCQGVEKWTCPGPNGTGCPDDVFGYKAAKLCKEARKRGYVNRDKIGMVNQPCEDDAVDEDVSDKYIYERLKCIYCNNAQRQLDEAAAAEQQRQQEEEDARQQQTPQAQWEEEQERGQWIRDNEQNKRDSFQQDQRATQAYWNRANSAVPFYGAGYATVGDLQVMPQDFSLADEADARDARSGNRRRQERRS